MATPLELLDEAIQSFAVSGIATVTIGGQTVEMRSMKELLEWRNHLLSTQAATRPGGGLRFQKITPVYE